MLAYAPRSDIGPPDSAGDILSAAIARFLDNLGDQPSIGQLGYGRGDIGALAESTLPQKRVITLAPNLSGEVKRQREELVGLFEDALVHSG